MLGSAERRRYQAWRPARNRFQQLHAVDVFERACGIAVPGGELCILAQLLRLLEIRGVLIRGRTAGKEEWRERHATDFTRADAAELRIRPAPTIAAPAATSSRPPSRWVLSQERSLGSVQGVRMPTKKVMRAYPR